MISLTTALIYIGVVATCLALEAFFSGSEIAFISANKAKILREAKENHLGAKLVKSLLSKPEALFSTTVVGTTLAMAALTTYSTFFIIEHFGHTLEWLNLVFLTPIILVFGEFVPKMFARSQADFLILKIARPLQIASYILYPITRLLSLYAQALKIILGENPRKGFFLSREEIKAALPASLGTDVTPSERRLVERILEFQKTSVKEMLHPLINVIAVEDTETVAEVMKKIHESGHSRLPVYHERIDKIIGVVLGFDCLLVSDTQQPVKNIMHQPFFVPESKPLDELLLELRSKPMAIAVNEYGGAEGIITMEDVVEEIVGEIEDEYDEPPTLYHRIGENSFIINARMEIDRIREELGLPIPKDEDEYQTLGGFLLHHMKEIPKKWDSITIEGMEFVIQSATDRSIEEVYVILHHPVQSSSVL